MRVVDSTLQATQAAGTEQVPTSHLVFEALRDSRDLVVVTKTAYGQVRVMSVRTSVRFRILRGDGLELLRPTDVALARDLNYNERDALAKQDEAAALQKSMQTDIVNQVLRRLAAIRPEQLRSDAIPMPHPGGGCAEHPMQLRLDQLSAHLSKGAGALKPVYTLYGDEPLLAQEAGDAIRTAARAAGFTERQVHTVSGAHFDWSGLLGAAQRNVPVR